MVKVERPKFKDEGSIVKMFYGNLVIYVLESGCPQFAWHGQLDKWLDVNENCGILIQTVPGVI